MPFWARIQALDSFLGGSFTRYGYTSCERYTISSRRSSSGGASAWTSGRDRGGVRKCRRPRSTSGARNASVDDPKHERPVGGFPSHALQPVMNRCRSTAVRCLRPRSLMSSSAVCLCHDALHWQNAPMAITIDTHAAIRDLGTAGADRKLAEAIHVTVGQADTQLPAAALSTD